MSVALVLMLLLTYAAGYIHAMMRVIRAEVAALQEMSKRLPKSADEALDIYGRHLDRATHVPGLSERPDAHH